MKNGIVDGKTMVRPILIARAGFTLRGALVLWEFLQHLYANY